MITKLITATFSVALATATLSASTADAPAASEQQPAAAHDDHAAGHGKKAPAKGKKAAHHGTAHHGKKAKAGKVDRKAAEAATNTLNKSSAPLAAAPVVTETTAAAA